MFVGSNNAIAVSLYKHLPFDFLRDTTPVAGMLRLPNVMLVAPSLPVHTVAELIDYAKARPGQLNYASAGNGTSLHMSAELFKSMTGINMVHIPYRGAAAFYPQAEFAACADPTSPECAVAHQPMSIAAPRLHPDWAIVSVIQIGLKRFACSPK